MSSRNLTAVGLCALALGGIAGTVAAAPAKAATAATAAKAATAATAANRGPDRLAAPGITAERPTFRPCPLTVVPAAPGQPAPPAFPAPDPSAPVIGGDGLGTTGLTIPAGTAPPAATKLSARAWLVADLDTGAVLGACAPHDRHPPASVQKLLLADTVMSKLDRAQVVTVTQQDMNFEPGSSAVGLLLNGRYTVETLWLGLFLNSGNDAANVLARLGGGPAGVPGTIAAMNARAHELGAYDTRAVTPSGLDGTGQSTSAYDLALIARDAFAMPDFRRYVATQNAKIPAQPPKDPRGFMIQNDNQLLYAYPGALGGKTGFTDLARHTYVGFAQRGSRRLVVTVLDAEARPGRGWQQGAALLDWGFSLPAGASVGHLVTPDELARSAASPPATPLAAARAGGASAGRHLPSTNTVLMILITGVAGGGALMAVAAAISLRHQRSPHARAYRGQRRHRAP